MIDPFEISYKLGPLSILCPHGALVRESKNSLPYLLRYPLGSINGDASQFGVEQIKCSNETLLRSWVGTGMEYPRSEWGIDI
jgi:hypothetical protein